jgi:phytoene desaturase
MKKSIQIIGSGFSSLSAACYLAKSGYKVSIFEKNNKVGGRAGQLKKEGFTFDIGPSWYWMPDVFDRFFNDFGKKTSDYYIIDKLDPAYRIFFEDEVMTIGDSLEKICLEFERIEKGSGVKLKKFIEKAQENYGIAVNKILYKAPGVSPKELVTTETFLRIDQFFKTISQEVRKKFKNPKLISTLEFPSLFLGAKPSKTPSFFSFMNFADFGLGTWHPRGGMYEIIKGMKSLAIELGVKIHTNHNIDKIVVKNNAAIGLKTKGSLIKSDIVISGADYHHSETLLDIKYRQYSETYWNSKVFAPSSLLFYIGLDKKNKKRRAP